MALTPSISVSQSAQSPNLVTLTDTSTGSDVTITKRRVYITDNTGTYLVESGTTTDYEAWDDFPATTSITLDILTEDKAVHILVQWLTAGNSVVVDYEDDYPLVEYNKQFFYELWQQQGLNPGIYQDTNYNNNLAILWSSIHGAIQCITLASDLSASQNCMNIGTNMRLNETLYF